MYKILILYNADHNLWCQYGTTTTSSVSGKKSTFTEFSTDDVEVLKAELLKLDSIYGFQNLRVVTDVTANYSVDIVIDNKSEDADTDKNDSIEIDADKEPDLEI